MQKVRAAVEGRVLVRFRLDRDPDGFRLYEDADGDRVMLVKDDGEIVTTHMREVTGIEDDGDSSQPEAD